MSSPDVEREILRMIPKRYNVLWDKESKTFRQKFRRRHEIANVLVCSENYLAIAFYFVAVAEI